MIDDAVGPGLLGGAMADAAAWTGDVGAQWDRRLENLKRRFGRP